MTKKILILVTATIFSAAFLQAQSVSINTDGSAPNASAILDVKSTNKGMLVPRLTSAQRTTISSPATGLLVFDNTTESFWFYTTSGWTELVAGNSQWNSDGAGNISNGNPGSVYVGAITGSGKLNVSSSGPIVADFNGGANTSYIRFLENGVYRGYLGSFSGAINDMDFGAGVGGKIHLTLANNPAVTLDNNGLGIGITTPADKLHINSGNILLSNSNLGIRLNAADRPLITRGWDPFTSGNYSGIGRWGIFMEPGRLTLGIPSVAGKVFEFAKYNTNSTKTTLATIDVVGAVKRPTQGAADLLPYCIGSIDINGNILGGTGNFSVQKVNIGIFLPIYVYDISLTSGTYNRANYAVLVTPYLDNTSDKPASAVEDSGGKIRIRLSDGGVTIQESFSFMVYKLF